MARTCHENRITLPSLAAAAFAAGDGGPRIRRTKAKPDPGPSLQERRLKLINVTATVSDGERRSYPGLPAGTTSSFSRITPKSR